jgi:Rieske Fe-S protein
MSQMNRRELLGAAALAAAACIGCGCGASSAMAAIGQTELADATSQPAELKVGAIADYKADGITGTWLLSKHIAVVRHDGKIFATTAVCTHMGGIVAKHGDNAYECPKHHAQYDIDGKVTKGPAKMNLKRFAITADADGNLTVDTSKSFTDDKWTDPASFVKVPS